MHAVGELMFETMYPENEDLRKVHMAYAHRSLTGCFLCGAFGFEALVMAQPENSTEYCIRIPQEGKVRRHVMALCGDCSGSVQEDDAGLIEALRHKYDSTKPVSVVRGTPQPAAFYSTVPGT